ncbi:MAG TPA: hypothetical protein VK779_10925 [Rhizomicrobium sp.]|jgi:hypothetical protein|nr:hypothetical protein [Rhizomicrobium sp.]
MVNVWEDNHRMLTEREATQGQQLGHMRYVLAFSLALAFCAGVLLLLSFFNW